jgi:hypothetical protein
MPLAGNPESFTSSLYVAKTNGVASLGLHDGASMSNDTNFFMLFPLLQRQSTTTTSKFHSEMSDLWKKIVTKINVLPDKISRHYAMNFVNGVTNVLCFKR